MNKNFLLFIAGFLMFPFWVSASINVESATNITELPASTVFKAEVVRVLEEQDKTRADGQVYQQQNVLLRGVDGEYKDKEITYYGIGELDVLGAINVEEGDKVLVLASPDMDGNTNFYVTEHVRTSGLLWLALIFAGLVLLVGKKQGGKSLIALVISFAIIMFMVLPLILRGYNPILISVTGSILILAINIYLTWGIKLKAHIAVVSIVLSLAATGVLAVIFTEVTKLTGATGEDLMFLLNIGGFTVDFKGLLLAGMILCTVGVLDDVIISQISAVEQIKIASHHLTTGQLFIRTLRIGVDHLSSMTNTLFLAYAGAALPLLLLFNVKQEPFLSFSQIINNELIATEIVRTLVASIGLTLAVPFSTLIAAKFLKVKVPPHH